MQNMMLPILVAVSVALGVWGLIQLATGVSGERKRLQERLSGDGKPPEGFDPATFTVVRREPVIGGLSSAISQLPMMKGLAQRIVQTWPSFSLAKFMFLSGGIGLGASTLIFLLTNSPFISLCVLVAGASLPLLYLNNRRNARQKQFMEQLPEALDFLSRILRAGHSLSTGLQMMAEELPQPVAGEFRRCYDAHSVGQSMEEALRDTAVRVDNPEFGFFVTAILIQRQTGGDLSEVLSNISGMIRQRIRLQQHVKAKTAEGRFTGYILLVFPVILFILCDYLSPSYAGQLLHTTTGIELLATAAGMLVLGTFMIRKITTIKV